MNFAKLALLSLMGSNQVMARPEEEGLEPLRPIIAKASMLFTIDGVETDKLIIGIYGDIHPVSVKNFFHLCKGDAGMRWDYQKKLEYSDTKVYAIGPHELEGGDMLNGMGRDGNGYRGHSSLGKRWYEEVTDPTFKFTRRGIVVMQVE